MQGRQTARQAREAALTGAAGGILGRLARSAGASEEGTTAELDKIRTQQREA